MLFSLKVRTWTFLSIRRYPCALMRKHRYQLSATLKWWSGQRVLGNLEMSRMDGSCVAGGISLPLGTGSEAAAIDRFSFFVERAVRLQPSPRSTPTVISTLAGLCGTSAMRCCDSFFIGNSLCDLKELLIPFVGTNPTDEPISCGLQVARKEFQRLSVGRLPTREDFE